MCSWSVSRVAASATSNSSSAAYLERIADTYARFFLHYDAAPLLIVNTGAIDLANSEPDYDLLLREIQRMRRGRQYFNPAPSGLDR